MIKECPQKNVEIGSSVIAMGNRRKAVSAKKYYPRQKVQREEWPAEEISERLNVPISEGKVNGREAFVMRDSGCGFAAVRATYVKPEQYLNEYEDLLLIYCTPRTFQKATVFVETNYYTGDLKVFVVDNLVVDIVFGNVVKIKGNEQRMAENHQIQSNEVEQMGHELYSSIEYQAQDAEGEKMKHLPDNSINQQESKCSKENGVGKWSILPNKTIKQQTQNIAVEKMKYLTDDNINQDASNNSTEKAEHLSDNDIISKDRAMR